MQVNYYDWLLRQIENESAPDSIIDLALDSKDKGFFPDIGSDYNLIRKHLIQVKAPRSIIRAFHESYDEFFRQELHQQVRRELKKPPTPTGN